MRSNYKITIKSRKIRDDILMKRGVIYVGMLQAFQISSCLYKLMNFDNDTPIDTLIGRLLAFIIMFERKIQLLKCKLAGNEQFHTRLAFQAIDIYRKNQIDSDALRGLAHHSSISFSEANAKLFLRRYSKNGALTYDEFLKLVAPKGNKMLAQRLLIRTYQKGTVLDEGLNRYVLELLGLYIKMCEITEAFRVAIQQNEDLSYLEVIEFFHSIIRNGKTLLVFLNQCTEQNEEYDIQPQDAVYLSYHIQSGSQLTDFTDLDIKELLCPIDMNFQKHVLRQTFFKQTSYINQSNSTEANQSRQSNFLGKTYQKMYHNSNNNSNRGSGIRKENGDSSAVRSDKYTVINTNRYPSGAQRSALHDQSYGGLYIDNFTKSNLNPVLELNHYISSNRNDINQRQVFHDDLNSNCSSISRRSKESAFDRS